MKGLEFMKIQPICRTYNYSQRYSNFVQNLYMQNHVKNNDSFQKSKNLSFGAVSKAFDPILDKSNENNLEPYGEILHECNAEEIERLCKARYQFLWWGNNNAAIAINLVSSEVEKVRQKKANALNRIAVLTQKEIKGLSNVSAQKCKIQKELILPIKTLKDTEKLAVPNGVLLYGDLPNNEKNNFVSWLKKEVLDAGGNFENVEYEMSNKAKSKEKVIQKLEFAKKHYPNVGHTVLFVDGIDKLFTTLNDDESIDAIDDFKNMIENCSQNYNVTFLVKTNLDIDDFDSAVIGDQRISDKYELKEGITEDEQEELVSLNDYLKHLTEQTTHTFYEFSDNDEMTDSEMMMRMNP